MLISVFTYDLLFIELIIKTSDVSRETSDNKVIFNTPIK